MTTFARTAAHGWLPPERLRYGERDGQMHVIPADSPREHEAAAHCWCHPTEEDGVWVHHEEVTP